MQKDMKKLFSKLMLVAMAAMTFTACEDVPEPYGKPYEKGGGNTEIEGAKGTGTKDDPFNAIAALNYGNGLASGEISGDYYYIKGKVVSVKEEFTTQYGNGTFYISEDGTSTNQFYAYRVMYLGNKKFANGDTQIAVGDDVIICAKITNYNGTIETAQKEGFLYELNGENRGGEPSGGGGDVGTPAGDGTLENPYNVAAAIAKCKEIGATANDDKYYVKGICVEGGTADATYGNASFYIADSKEGARFYCFQVLGTDGKKMPSGYAINVDDEVLIYGPIYNYKGNTPETAGKGAACIVTINGKSTNEGGSESDETIGTAEAPITVADALSRINALENGGKSTMKAYVKGKVVKVATNQTNFEKYGNLNYYISEDGQDANTIQVYAGDGLNGEKFKSITDIAQGDEVVVFGTLYKYVKNDNTTPEITDSYLTSLVKGSGGEGGGGGEQGTVQEVTVAQFNAAAVSNDVWYQLKGKVTNLKEGDIYGNFDLVDETGSVYVYGLLSEKGGEKKKFQDLVAAKGIKEGSTITIIGNRGEYNGKIEVMNAYFVSIEAGGGDNPNPNPNPGGDTNGDSYEVTMASFGLANQADATTLTSGDVTFTFAKEGGKNAPKYYEAAGGSVRMYAQNSLTITAKKAIAKVVITTTDPQSGTVYNGNDALYGEAGGAKVTTKKDSDTQVTFSNFSNSTLKIVNDFETNSGGTQLRVMKVAITYAK